MPFITRKLMGSAVAGIAAAVALGGGAFAPSAVAATPPPERVLVNVYGQALEDNFGGAVDFGFRTKGDTQQRWRVVFTGEQVDGVLPVFKLQNVFSGRCLAVPSFTPGTELRTETCSSSSRQRWNVRLNPGSQAAYLGYINRGTGKAMTEFNKVLTDTFHYGQNQIFKQELPS